MRPVVRNITTPQNAAAALELAAQSPPIGPAKRRSVPSEARLTPALPAARTHQTLAPAAQRDLRGWLTKLSLDTNHPDPVRAIAAAELARAQAIDPRVTPADMHRAVLQAMAAARITPAEQRVLYGFTRLIDAKFRLTSEPGGKSAIEVLASAALSRPADATALLGAIDAGPGDGSPHILKPQTKAELVAAVVRFALLGTASSLQISISKELGDWIQRVLAEARVPVTYAMGGAGGFCANMSSALSGVQSHFYSADPIPGQMAERFAPGVRVIDATGAPGASAALASNQHDARINWAIDWNVDETFSILGRRSVLVDGTHQALGSKRSARVIMSTPADDRPGFALDDSALAHLATQTDKFFGVGPHYLTKGSPESCRTGADELSRQYRTMRASNPDLLVHHQYVVPKAEANEHILMEKLAGVISSTAMNACELPGLLQRIAAAGLARWKGEVDVAKADEPSVMLDGALALKSGLDLHRVHIHGFFGDLVIKDGNPDPERIKLASLRARQLGSMKTANASGEITSHADIVDVVPGVEGAALAAVQRFADSVQERFGLSSLERDLVAQRWWYRDAHGTVHVFTPARGIHDLTGGKVSLGDCIDNAQMVYEDPPAKRALPPHPRAANRRL